MNKERRNNLKNVITKARRLLEEDIAKVITRYGILAGGKRLTPDELSLDPQARETRERIDKAIDKERIGGLSLADATDRYVREVSFTSINRLSALRAMEVRGLLSKETVMRRPEYGGRSLRERDIAEGNPTLSPDEVLNEALLKGFRDVGQEIQVLFDVDNEYSLVKPNPKATRELIRLLTEDVTTDDWAQDDIIGWIYQYFNEEARVEFKRSGRKPGADDIIVTNQFYTPHWVVRALTDNTLGRIWLEMKDRCPYLIPESDDPKAPAKVVEKRMGIPNPSEGDFKDWLADPEKYFENKGFSKETLSVEQLCSFLVPLSEEPLKHEPKSVREIKVLDPACGSGHFLVYAFDILYRMYLEDEPNISAEDIPSLILEHNLYGIDIDLRAVQLAALSLYLKAKSYSRNTKIKKLNLVVADARIRDGDLAEDFLSKFNEEPELRELSEKLICDLNNTIDIGSLYRLKEHFKPYFEGRKGNPKRPLEEIFEAFRQFEKESTERRDMGGMLFATEAEKSVGLLELLMQEYDVLLMNPPYGGMTAKAKSYLRDYYERTHHDLYAAFIEQTVDLAKPGGFVGMLTSRTFMFLGMFQKVREEILWDDAVPKLLLDTGLGILDGATVETAATVIRKNVMAGLSSNPASQVCSFCRLDYFNTYIKELAFLESFMHYAHNGAHDLWYRVMLGELSKTPGISYYSYWASPSLRALFMQYPPLDRDVAKKPDQPKIADVKGGFRTLDDPRFIRCFWEVDTEIIGRGKKWVPFAKGGDYAKFYSDFGLLVNWENEGEEIRDYATLKGRSRSLDNEAFYFHEGLTHSYITTIGLIAGFGIRYLPPGIIFGHAERAIFSIRTDQLWAFLGLISARLFLIERLMLNPTRKWEAIDGANMPTVVEPSLRLELQAHEAYDILREINTANETSTVYIKPLILQVLHNYNPEEHPIMRHPFAEQFRWADWPSLRKIRSICWENIKKELKQDATAMQEIKPSLRLLAELAINREEETSKRIEELQKQIDEEVYRIYEISDEDRALIEKEIALRKGEVVGEAEPIEEEGLEEAADGAGVLTIDINQQVRNHVERLISFYVKQSVEEDPDGIVPFDESFEDNLLRRVRGKIARDFGEGQVGEIEGEIAEILGKSLGEWLLRDYFDFHVSLYKRRPIFWQLISSPIGRTKTPAFSCLVNYHKLTRDTIPKIQAFYLTKVKQRAEFEKDRLFVELEEARATKDAQKVRRLEKAYNTAASTFDELVNFEGIFATIHNPREDKTKLPANPKWVDQRIAEIRDNGYNPIIDYGIRVNIEPLKQAKILPKAADRIK